MIALLDKARRWGIDRATYVRNVPKGKERDDLIARYGTREGWIDDARSVTSDPDLREQVTLAASEAFLKAVRQ